LLLFWNLLRQSLNLLFLDGILAKFRAFFDALAIFNNPFLRNFSFILLFRPYLSLLILAPIDGGLRAIHLIVTLMVYQLLLHFSVELV
jgi:hypothetical protein